MSYSARVKEELLHKKLDKSCCRKAELAAYLQAGGVLNIGGGSLRLEVTSENSALMRRVFSLYKDVGLLPQVLYRRQTLLKKNNLYLLRLSGAPAIHAIASWLGETGEDPFFINHRLPDLLIKKRCCRRSYLRGLFLIRGSISNPEHSYHLEITLAYEEFARQVMELMDTFSLTPRLHHRRQEFMIYFKDGEQISQFLRVIGAGNALMQFENTRVMKGMRNQVNRLVNCDTANLSKTVTAAQKHIEAIRLIKESVGWESLPSSLQAIARLRLEYPEATLKELGELCEPPLGKSGINHRLRRIEELAEKIISDRG